MKWTGDLTLNALFTSGNSETENIGETVSAARRSEQDRITLGAGYCYGRQGIRDSPFLSRRFRVLHRGEPRRRLRPDERDVESPVVDVVPAAGRHLVRERLRLRRETIQQRKARAQLAGVPGRLEAQLGAAQRRVDRSGG